MPSTHTGATGGAAVHPGRPVLTSASLPAPHRPLVTLEYFELRPGSTPVEVHERHRILVPSDERPLRAVAHRGGSRIDVVLGPGDMAVAPAGTAEGWSWDEPMRAVVLWIEPEAAERFVTERLHLLMTRSRFERALVVHHPELTTLARAMLRAIARGGVGADVMFDTMATQFLTMVARDFGEPDEAALSDGLSAERHGRIEEFVGRHLHRRITVAEIAKAAGLSPAALSHGLKAGLGTTPLRLVARLRARGALDLLEAGERTLAQIASDCGYADQAHLTRSFKRAFGLTPSAWRAAHR